MKYLSHLALPLLMFGLLALAFVLPKFVQKAAPEDGSIFSPSATTVVPKPSKKIKPVAFPKNNKVENTFKQPDQSSVDSQIQSDIDYNKLIPPFISTVKDGDYDQADQMLVLLKDAIPEAVHGSLRYSLQTSKGAHSAKQQYEKQLLAAQEQVEAAKIAIKESLANNNNGTVTDINKVLAKRSSLPVVKSLLKPSAAIKITNKAGQPEATDLDLVAPAPTLTLPKEVSVNFGFNSSQVPYVSYTSLDRTAESLKNDPRLAVELRGYSDSVGNAEYNRILSETRSNQIKLNLTNRGVSADQIVVKTFGATVSPTGRSASHRRVDIVFYER